MINLTTLFKNHFDSDKIGDDKLKVFSEDHIQRLAVNNGSGLFTAILNDTVAAHNAYFGSITNEATNSAVQKARTMSVDNIIKTFKDEASRREGLVKSVFGKDTPAYQEFFPQGITEYREATKATVETLINRMVNAANAHLAEVGKEFVAIFTAIKTNFVSARSSQLGKIGEVATAKTTTETTRNALETQHTKNVHYIGFTFPGNVSRCMDFFDQSIIRAEQSSDTDGLGRAVGTITNSANGQAIHNAVIEIVGENIPKVRSKPDGKFRTHNVDTGVRQFLISKPGFTSVTVSKEIVDEGDTELNVGLNPE